MPAIPTVVTGTAIATSWGNAVRDALNLPVIRAERITSAQSITNDTATTVILNSIIREDDEPGSLSFNTGTGVLTIAHQGWYAVTFGVLWAAGATGYRACLLLRSGVQVAGVRDMAVTTASITQYQNGAALLYITAGQTLAMEVRHTQGAALNVNNNEGTFLAAHRVRAI